MRQSAKWYARAKGADTVDAELAACPSRRRCTSRGRQLLRRERARVRRVRKVITCFVSLPELQERPSPSVGPTGRANAVFKQLVATMTKFEGVMRDFLFEDKGCTFICFFGLLQRSKEESLRSVLCALEMSAQLKARFGIESKIGISVGPCVTGTCGNTSRRDFVVMGSEVNMAARLMGKAARGTVLVSEPIYTMTKKEITYDMTRPIVLKGRDGDCRALMPYGRRRDSQANRTGASSHELFVGRTDEIRQLSKALQSLAKDNMGSAFILEGSAGMGKSAVVRQLQSLAEEMRVPCLLGAGSAIEKQTPFLAFRQMLLRATGLSDTPSYSEVVSLKKNFLVDDDDIRSLGMIIPGLSADGSTLTASDISKYQNRASSACMKIFSKLSSGAILIFEDATGSIQIPGCWYRWSCAS